MRKLVIAIVLVAWLVQPAAAGKLLGPHWRSQGLLEPIALIMAFDTVSQSWYPFGTGVLYDVDSTYPDIYLITNRHIYVNKDSLRMSFPNFRHSEGRTFAAEAFATFHKNTTKALMPEDADSDFVAIPIARPHDSFSIAAITEAKTVRLDDLEYGEQVLFFGYPYYADYGLYGNEWNLPVCRDGSVAFFATQDIYFAHLKFLIPGMYLIDGVSMGGNSGGPVFIRRAYVTKTSDGALTVAYDMRLAGIVCKHYPIIKSHTIPLSKIPAVIELVDSTRLADSSLVLQLLSEDYTFTYEENSDLAVVISIDMIIDYVKKQLANQRIGLVTD